MAVTIVPTGLILVALVHTVLIQHLAIHLCRWPATVSCDVGVPILWWVVIAGLWGVVATATADAARFVVAPDRSAGYRLLAWAGWGPAVVATTWLSMQDRTLHQEDLLVGTLLALWALGLVAHTLWCRRLLPKLVLRVLFAGLGVAAVSIPLWAPPVFRAAEHAWLPPRPRTDHRVNPSGEAAPQRTLRASRTAGSDQTAASTQSDQSSASTPPR